MPGRWTGGLHWTQTHRAWLGLFAPLPSGRVILRHEMTWIRTAPEDAADQMLVFFRDHRIGRPLIVANPELFPAAKDIGETVSVTFQRAGISLMQGSDDRINGWSRVRSWLRVRVWPDGSSGPSLIIHPDCTRLLRTLPTLVSDPRNPEDIAETPDAHPAHGLRYYVMSEPPPWQADARPQPGPGTWGHALRTVYERARKPARPVLGADLVNPFR